MTFVNRTQAGRQLAEKLHQYLFSRGELEQLGNVAVVGLPRGGVPVALEVARKLGCQIELIVSKKIPFPGQPEYAIGAVSADAVVVLSPDIPQDPTWKAYIEQQRQRLLQSTGSIQRQFYELSGYQPASFKDKIVFIIDDGIATGMTALAAIETARRRGAQRIIIAAPVMSSDSYHQLGRHCDEVIAISVPEQFLAVGKHYANFTQTDNEEVVKAMRESSRFPLAHCSSAPESGGRFLG